MAPKFDVSDIIKRCEPNLKCLELDVRCTDALRTSNFKMASASIQQLTLLGFRMNLNDIQNICAFKMIKRLNLSFTERIYVDDLLSIAFELPLLTQLTLMYSNILKSTIILTSNGLLKLIKTGNRLRYIELWGVIELHINQDDFMNLVNVSKESRRDICLNISSRDRCSHNVPKKLEKSYRKWIHLVYSRM